MLDYIHNAEITQNVPRGQQGIFSLCGNMALFQKICYILFICHNLGRRSRRRNNRNNSNELAQASNPTHPGINIF